MCHNRRLSMSSHRLLYFQFQRGYDIGRNVDSLHGDQKFDLGDAAVDFLDGECIALSARFDVQSALSNRLHFSCVPLYSHVPHFFSLLSTTIISGPQEKRNGPPTLSRCQPPPQPLHAPLHTPTALSLASVCCVSATG